MLIWFISCQSPLRYEPHHWIEETEQNQILTDELFQPVGFRRWKEGWMIADKGDGTLVWLKDTGELEVQFDDLDAPQELIKGENELYLSSAETIYRIDDSGERSIIAQDRSSPRQLLYSPIGLLWIEEGNPCVRWYTKPAWWCKAQCCNHYVPHCCPKLQLPEVDIDQIVPPSCLDH